MENLEELKQALREHQLMLQEFRELLNSRGWDLLVNLINEQVDVRSHKLKARAVGIEDVLEAEYTKGEIAAFSLVKQIVNLTIDAFADQVILLEKEIKYAETPDAYPQFNDPLGTKGGAINSIGTDI